jgi:nucleoside-diphosphate-sugar epimerase
MSNANVMSNSITLSNSPSESPVLILGSGKVGTALLELLPTALATTTNQAKAVANSRLVLLDALDAEAVKQTIATLKPKAVVMAMAPGGRMTAEAYQSFFLTVTSNLIAALSGAEHLVYLGSGALYGNHKGAVVNEDAQALATFNRGVTQALAQAKAMSYNKTTLLRLGGLYDFENSALGFASFDGPFGGEAGRMVNFTHIEDAARAVVFAIEKEEEMLGVYNLANLSIKAEVLMPLVSQWTGQINDWTESNFVLSCDRILAKGFSLKHTELY